MKALQLAACCLVGIGLLTLASQPPPQRNESREYPTSLMREEQSVTVNGVKEVWQLTWINKTHEVCEPSDASLTCPCEGFAYGEGGELDLVRLRKNVEFDLLPITPLFEEQFGGEGRIAVVQRWEPDRDKDLRTSLEDLPAVVGKRPSVQVMHFADYDHDGFQNEFYLQTEAAPCGKSVGIVIGISKTNPTLHVFGTASKPGKPLYMQKTAWEGLRDASGPIEFVHWRCGDHGSEEQTTLRLHWSTAGIDGTRLQFACNGFEPGRLLQEEPL
jgi:hypothetical protein